MRILLVEPDGVETVWRQKGGYRTQKSWRYVVSRQITIEQQTSLIQTQGHCIENNSFADNKHFIS